MRRTTLRGIFLGILLIVVANRASAIPTVNYTNSYDPGTNLWTYESTTTNDTLDLLYDFVIYPTAEPLAGSDMTGDGWGPADIGNISPYFVHWMADFGFEITPGGTMGGFWFVYSGDTAGDLGPLSYTVTLWDLVNDNPYTFDSSTIPSSTPIPEPGTLVLLIAGLAGVWIMLTKKGRCLPKSSC